MATETVRVDGLHPAVGGVARLEELAAEARSLILKAVAHAGAGHVGGPLSAVDVLCALYWRTMRVRPEDPQWPDRDRFVLSKGHSAIALYAVLALRGFLPVAELDTFDAIDSRLQGHPDMTKLAGLDMSTGSLGLGFSAAVGIALGARLRQADFHTYVMLGDGECNEGIVWEAAELANRYGLDNLTAIVDHNGLQQTGFVENTLGTQLPPYEPGRLADRWRAFGWTVVDVDGHDLAEVVNVLGKTKQGDGRPCVVISHTVKGRGVSFMENELGWHSRVPTAEELDRALKELRHN